MLSKKSLLSFLLIFFFVEIVNAQMPGIPAPGKMPELFGEFKMPEVGSYSEYKLTYPAEKIEIIVRMSLVGKEKIQEEKELYWYEYQTKNTKTADIDIVKMLLSGDPQKEGTIHRMIFKHNQDKAMELPAEMIQMINAPIDIERKKVKEEVVLKKLGKETLKTQAGSFECTHLQYISDKKVKSDIWQNMEIPFYGLVKSVTKEMSMELQKFGKDAKSAITEEPEELRMPGMEELEIPDLPEDAEPDE